MPKTLNKRTAEVAPQNLKIHPRNVNQGDLGAVIESIRVNGFWGRVVVNERTGHICAGNHRVMAAKELGFATVPVEYVDVDEETELRILLADNRATRLGAIGYHPSLLPIHRGRDAVRWTIHAGDKIAGGSVYWLSETTDGGPIAAQRHVFVRPGDTPEKLWRRDLFPLGLELFKEVIGDLKRGRMVKIRQRQDCATWEPSFERPPLFRPDLDLIGSALDGFEIVAKLPHEKEIGGFENGNRT